MEGGVISNNTATLGVVVLAKSTLNMRTVKVQNNTVRKGSIYASWSSTLHLGQVTVTHNTGFHGGGVYVVGSNASITHSKLVANHADEGGGAIFVNLFGNLTVVDTSVTNSTAPTGGAIAAYMSRVLIADGSQLLWNTARPKLEEINKRGYYGLGVGGAIYSENTWLTITDSTVAGNQAVMDGGECQCCCKTAGMIHCQHSQWVIAAWW
jgi:hypothetical protein